MQRQIESQIANSTRQVVESAKNVGALSSAIEQETRRGKHHLARLDILGSIKQLSEQLNILDKNHKEGK